MKILAIETSCDETAVSIIEAKNGLTEPYFSVLGNSLFSQIEIHKEFGGVFPMMAKREHSKKLPLLLVETLNQARMYSEEKSKRITNEKWDEAREILKREDGLFDELKIKLENISKPEIDVIAVTYGPGLEPALWVGISCAEALSKIWDIPVIPVNHMEGHILSILLDNPDKRKTEFPAIALLVSGGHTEIIEIEKWGSYRVIGQTRDDAVGEAFDKVARMLGLPYPGGPQISRLAEIARKENLPKKVSLPRPMIHSKDLDFSFSGLKTAVLYHIRDFPISTEKEKMDIAREFEDAVTEVLINKTQQAIDKIGAKTLIIGGGVIANKELRNKCMELENKYSDLIVLTPTHALSTDNSLMIACAGYVDIILNPKIIEEKKKIIANGNASLEK